MSEGVGISGVNTCVVGRRMSEHTVDAYLGDLH